MRKSAIALVIIALAAVAGFANGNAEKLTTIEGTVVSITIGGGLAQVALRTEAGDEIVVELPPGEVERLRLRTESRIRLEGVYVGVPAAQREQLQARILARVVNADGTDVTVKDPVRLTEQDRLQIREWEQEQTVTRTEAQTQTRMQTQTREGAGAGDGSGQR